MEWVKANGAKASQGTFADAAAFGEMLFNCTSGMGSIAALKLVSALRHLPSKTFSMSGSRKAVTAHIL